MTAITSTTRMAGAVSRKEVSWHAINWQKAYRIVRRLQARIVKATREGRWNKVKVLQRLLTRSYSAKVLAVRRVTENQGKRTPGVDGVIWNTPNKKAKAVNSLRQRGYHPQPLRRIYIPKDETRKTKRSFVKMRPLSIPVMKDRAMQALYLMALEPIAETTADPNSYGFRKERATADAIEQCFTVLSGNSRAEWIWDADIKGCFDNLNHEWLMANIPMEKAILHKWLKAGFMEKDMLYPTENGTPQGGIISPVLMNMALDGLEGTLREYFPPRGRGQNRTAPKVNLVRYADDFIITGANRETLEQEVKPLVEHFLSERGLAISQEKSSIVHVTEGFDFLGQNVRKYSGKVLIKPSKKSLKRLMAKVRTIIHTHPAVSAGQLIVLLNPVIRGWVNYHRHAVSSRTFRTVDHLVFQALWRWAIRRHPHKGKRWVKDKYFKVVGRRKWVFSGKVNGKTVRLFDAYKTTIQRHDKVVGTANPFDPAWETYFEKRLDMKMVDTLRGRRHLLHLWKAQNGICPICKQKITKMTGWHSHHIVWRSLGGSDGAANRLLVHPNCHNLIHSRGLSVEKPRPHTRALSEA